jgi:hypothetical protein
VRPKGFLMKNSNDIIGNRTRDLPAYSSVPQTTAPLRALFVVNMILKFHIPQNAGNFLTNIANISFQTRTLLHAVVVAT